MGILIFEDNQDNIQIEQFELKFMVEVSFQNVLIRISAGLKITTTLLKYRLYSRRKKRFVQLASRKFVTLKCVITNSRILLTISLEKGSRVIVATSTLISDYCSFSFLRVRLGSNGNTISDEICLKK